VVWVPDPGLRELYRGHEGEVLAGMTGERRGKDDGEVGEVGDGWGELLSSLEEFEYEKYGIVVEDR
jgi:pseudouridine-5'-monophosphatase